MIVVLAIIALIAVPIVLNIIENSKKGAFRDSVYGIEKAAELHMVSSDYNSDQKVEFICNGKTCETNDEKKLNFKGEVPISGSVIIENNIITINYIKNNSYCALGTRENLDIQRDCTKLDITPAELTLEQNKITSNSILIRIRANDNESGIKRIEYYIDGESIGSEDKKLVGMVDETYLFNDLDKNTEYQIKIKATNGNNKETKKTINIKTEEINNPNITYTNTPNNAVDGYLERQVINVAFNNSNITNPSYYIKTTRKGISSLSVTESCGSGTEPGACTDITITNTLDVNTWYKVSGNVALTYSESSDTTGTLYAITYDGRNYSGSTTGTISKIIQPATGINLNRTSATLENGSTLQLTAMITPSNATNKTITWSSSNTGIVTVSNSGLVMAKGAGTATITASTSNGLIATTNIIVKDYLSNVVSIGDYIAYDAGVWTETKSVPTNQGEFGGYIVGKNRANSISWSDISDNAVETTATRLNGWRVLNIDVNNNIVTIIHAGIPECYYHGTDTALSISAMNNRTKNYINNAYALSAHAMTYDEALSITGSELATDNTLRKTGASYWLASAGDNGYLRDVYYPGSIGWYINGLRGIRPVIVLKANVGTTGKVIDLVGNEAWNLVSP